MSIDDLNGRTNNQLPDGNNQPVSATTNKISDSISVIDNLPGLEKFKNMLTLQPAITGHKLDTEIEGKKIYAHLTTFREYLLSPEFVDRVSKINGTFENFVNKLEGLKPQIDRVSVGSEGVIEGIKVDEIISEQSYNDFKAMYNSIRGVFKGIVNPANGKPDTDRLTISLLVALKGLPMLGSLRSPTTSEIEKDKDLDGKFLPSRIGDFGYFAISPLIVDANALKGYEIGIYNPVTKKTEINTDVEFMMNAKDKVRFIRFELGAVNKEIIAGVVTLHHISGGGATLQMK